MINEVFGAYPRSRHLTDRSVVDRPKPFIEGFAQSADVCDYPSNAALLTTDQLNPDAGVLKRRFDSGGDRNREG